MSLFSTAIFVNFKTLLSLQLLYVFTTDSSIAAAKVHIDSIETRTVSGKHCGKCVNRIGTSIVWVWSNAMNELNCPYRKSVNGTLLQNLSKTCLKRRLQSLLDYIFSGFFCHHRTTSLCALLFIIPVVENDDVFNTQVYFRPFSVLHHTSKYTCKKKTCSFCTKQPFESSALGADGVTLLFAKKTNLFMKRWVVSGAVVCIHSANAL